MGTSVLKEMPLTWTGSLPQNQHGICFKSETVWLKVPRIEHKNYKIPMGRQKIT